MAGMNERNAGRIGSLNPSMSRGGFIKTMGVGMAAAATGLSVAAKAQTAQNVVYPTGIYPDDLNAVQTAVNNGGTVLLKSTNVAGKPTAFNFGDVAPGDANTVEISTDVVIIGEGPASSQIALPDKNKTVLYYAPSTLKDGSTINPGTVIYGGGYNLAYDSGYSHDNLPGQGISINPPAGAFSVMAKTHFEIKNLWFYGWKTFALMVFGGDGTQTPCRISGNKITDPLGGYWWFDQGDWFEADGITFNEFPFWGNSISATFSGDIFVENNEMNYFSDRVPPNYIINSQDAMRVGMRDPYYGTSLFFYTYSPATYYVKNNNFFNYSTVIAAYGRPIAASFGFPITTDQSMLHVEGNLYDSRCAYAICNNHLWNKHAYFGYNKFIEAPDDAPASDWSGARIVLYDNTTGAVDDSHGVTVEYNEVGGHAWAGVTDGSDWGLGGADNLLIRNNHFTGAFVSNPVVVSWLSSGWTVTNNTFGMTKAGQASGIFDYQQSILQLYGQNHVVSNNTITGKLNDFAGIRLTDSVNCSIQGNKMDGAVGYPIYLDGITHDIHMVGNNITNIDLRYPYIPLCWLGPNGTYTPDAELSSPLMPFPQGTDTQAPISGRFGNALEFTGKDHIYVNIPKQEPMTISVWINVKPEVIIPDGMEIFSWGGNWQLIEFRLFADGYLQYGQYDQVTWQPLTGQTIIKDGTWHHVVVVKDDSLLPGNNVTLYVDGQVDGAGTITNSPTPTNSQIGARFSVDSYDYNFNGLIDDIALWNRALGDVEIRDLYNGIHPDKTDPSVVAYWACDRFVMKGNAQKLEDLSLYGNSGYANFVSCPSEVKYGANVYLGPNAVNNTLRGYSGGKVEDWPGSVSDLDIVLVDESTGNAIEVYYTFGDISTWTMPDPPYQNNDPAKPYGYDFVELPYKSYTWASYDPWFWSGEQGILVAEAPIMPKTTQMMTLTVNGPNGQSTFTFPTPFYYFSYSDFQMDWFYQWNFCSEEEPCWGTLDPHPVIALKGNSVTGFEPMKGAGGIGPAISNGLGQGMKAWIQSFRSFLQTNPTKVQIQTWMAQHHKPSQTKLKSTKPKELGAKPGFMPRLMGRKHPSQ